MSIPGILADPDGLDERIIWHLTDPAIALKKGSPMPQMKWTIEVRINFTDQERNKSIDKAVIEHTVQLLAKLQLLCDGEKPDGACWCDDWFHGQRFLELYGNKLAEAEEQYGDKIKAIDVSDELLAAAQAAAKKV